MNNKKVKPQRNIIDLATYIVLFPQLIAGPIVNYKTVEHELNDRKHNWNQIANGTRRFIIGLAKKVIIANNVAILADAVFNTNAAEIGTSLVIIGAIAYALQIYFDFSGYSDMAIGLGRIFGFKFLENFNYPYIASSITDFWRRWHISLSSWFREYVYIPLGGNRCSKLKWYRNIVIVWCLTGLWHGANWNFILWGLYFAIILIVEKMFLNRLLEKIPEIYRHIYAIILILVGWIIFRVENINELMIFLKHLFIYNRTDLPMFLSNNGDVLFTIPFMLLGLICCFPIFKKVYNNIKKYKIMLYLIDVFIIFTFFITIIFLLAATYNPFIYFRF